MHRRARYLAPCVAALLVGSASAVAVGAPGAPGLAGLARAERSAELELFASESALAQARAETVRLAATRRELERALARTRLRANVVRASLATTHRNIATLLRHLYVNGEAEPLAVLLGARSLDAVLEGIDGLERATALNRRLAVEARVSGDRLAAVLARLSRADVELDAVEARARAAAEAHAAAVGAKRSTLATIRREQGLTSERLAAAEERARTAQRASARIARAARSAATPAAAPAEAPPALAADAGPAPPGGRLFVADAVAYHLPGRTASGLPVGVGVIAVDPTVIPLGTRVFVPGYGPAVAADVGSAIKGNIIDLWMPSTAAARAWGRRTVTITIYG